MKKAKLNKDNKWLLEIYHECVTGRYTYTKKSGKYFRYDSKEDITEEVEVI